MTILLRQIWPIAEPRDYKLHFARWNGEKQPLEVWIRDKREWQGWPESRPARGDFNRPFLFSMMQFYHQQDVWMLEFEARARLSASWPPRQRSASTSQNRVPFVGPCGVISPDRDGVTVSTRTKRVLPARLSAVIV